MATKRCGTCQGRKKLSIRDLKSGETTIEDCPTCGATGEVPVPDDPPPPPKPPALRLWPRKKK